MNEELTPWFNGMKHKPARPGVYMLLSGGMGLIGYQFWDGQKWGVWCSTAHGAAISGGGHAHSYHQDDWRGLAHNPNKLDKLQ